jgi:hypothetical protein
MGACDRRTPTAAGPYERADERPGSCFRDGVPLEEESPLGFTAT